jgi:hypothetical protein
VRRPAGPLQMATDLLFLLWDTALTNFAGRDRYNSCNLFFSDCSWEGFYMWR